MPWFLLGSFNSACLHLGMAKGGWNSLPQYWHVPHQTVGCYKSLYQVLFPEILKFLLGSGGRVGHRIQNRFIERPLRITARDDPTAAVPA